MKIKMILPALCFLPLRLTCNQVLPLLESILSKVKGKGDQPMKPFPAIA